MGHSNRINRNINRSSINRDSIYKAGEQQRSKESTSRFNLNDRQKRNECTNTRLINNSKKTYNNEIPKNHNHSNRINRNINRSSINRDNIYKAGEQQRSKESTSRFNLNDR